MRIQLLASALASLAVTGCGPQPTSIAAPAAPLAASSTASAPALRASKREWLAALNGTFKESSSKTDAQGVTEFGACFGTDEKGKCRDFMFGKRDAFKKAVSFTPAWSQLNEFGVDRYLHSRVVVPDCRSPSILLSARYFSKGGWLFLNRVSALADGELVLDHEFPNHEVNRNSESWGVDESAAWVLSETEVAALEKIPSAKQLIVRLTGSKGYVSVAADKAQEFRSDVSSLLRVFELLSRATSPVLPAACGDAQDGSGPR